jgi:DNA-binding CsgD family transcriptional regulator/tetratricopeptide (TPR) repeat protein
VLVARAAQGEMPLSFAGVADLLGGELDELLPALAAPRREALEVALLLASPRGAAPDAHAVAAAFLDALRLLAPVLVAVDDVQWLDPPSATALAFALRRVRDEPVRFLFTRRVPSPPPLGLDRPPPWLPVHRLEVGPLSLAALQRLLRVRRGDSLTRPALRRVHDVSGGNPLFALELAGALEGRWAELAPGRPLPVPDELGALLRGRLAGLPPATREALLAAALLSEPTVERVGPEALSAALDAGVVGLAGRRVRFTHPLLAATIVESAGPQALRAMHRRLAEAAPHPEQRARHLALAAEGPDEAVAVELEAAAAAVAARGAPEAAAELAEHAHRLTPSAAGESARGGPDGPAPRVGSDAQAAARARRALHSARYAWAAGDAARARRHLQAAAEGPLRAQALVDLARLEMHAGDRRAASMLYREAEEAAAGDRALLAQIHEGLAWCLFLTREDVPAAARHAREAVALADDPVVLGDALSVQAQAEFFLGGGLPSAPMERALAIHPADTADVRVLRQPRMHWAVVLQNADRLDEARELLAIVRASAAEHGDDSAGPWVLMRLGQVELLAGNWDAAAELLESAHELAIETGQRPLETMTRCALALLYAQQGRAEAARAAAAEGLAVSRPLGDGIGTAFGLWALGTLELSLGNAEAAARHLGELARETADSGIVDPGALRWLGDLIEALVELGRVAEAEELTAAIEARGTELGRASALAMGARGRALLAGDPGAALTAAELYEALPFERARALLTAGSLHRRARQRRAAREALEEARAQFAALGARVWQERAEAELRSIGGRAPSPDGLTPSERRVAELVAEGQTNREVAAALFLSERTVESHLSNAYRKLGVRSRTELARKVQ